MRCQGFAELTFRDSAGLAFARALEMAETDAHQVWVDAWIIEDRRITFSFEGGLSNASWEGLKRLLDMLVEQALTGEAYLKAPCEQWIRQLPSRVVAYASLRTLPAENEDGQPFELFEDKVGTG